MAGMEGEEAFEQLEGGPVEEMIDEEVNVPPEQRFDNKSIPVRLLVVSAGVLMNFALGWVIFVTLAILFGQNALIILNLLPLSLLGVLLVFAGAQLALMVNDLTQRKDLFVALIMLAITLTVNLAVAFLCGIVIAYVLKSDRVSV